MKRVDEAFRKELWAIMREARGGDIAKAKKMAVRLEKKGGLKLIHQISFPLKWDYNPHYDPFLALLAYFRRILGWFLST